MKSWMKVLLLILAGVLALGVGAFGSWYFLEKQNEQEMEEIERQAREAIKEERTVEKEKIRIGELSFARISDREIEIRWPDQWDASVREYQVERRTPGTEGWEQVGSLPAGQGTAEGQLSWVDTLEDGSIRQYEYRVQAEPLDPEACEVQDGEPVMASNLLLCIDPGHYAGKNMIQTEPVYAEGDFTLPLAKELEKILREEYGVTVRMTRDSGDISLGGYSNDSLDSGHISLRGEAAKGADLFISLHTNANLEGANGCATEEQPISINKPILILNEPACQDPQVIRLANAEGVPLPPDDDVRWLAGAIPRFRPDSKPSMGQDVDARRPTEVEEFSGVVRRLSARHGLPTPANDFFYRAIRAIEAGWARN